MPSLRASIATTLIAALLATVATLASPASAATLIEQLGQDIDGETAGDQSGYSVAMSADGDRIAIGAPFNGGSGTNAGHVRIYDSDGTTWTQTGTDFDADESFDEFGYSVAMSADGNRIAIGAPDANAGVFDNGLVRVFDWNGTTWTQTGTDIDGETAGDQSGRAIAMSNDGNRIAIGADFNDGNGSNAGHVRVYDWNGTTWTQTGTDIDGETASDVSGWSVATSAHGNRIAVGAFLNDGNGSNSGHVRVFTTITEPAAPVIDAATGGDELIQVTWTTPEDGGSPITGYTATAAPGGQTCSSTTTTCEIVGLTNGVEYAISVTATNAAGTSATSASVFVTLIDPTTAPGPINGPIVEPGDEAVTVTWTAPDDGGTPILSYTVTLHPGSHTCNATAPTTSCSIDGLANGTTYAATVVASNAKGAGGAGTAASVTPTQVRDVDDIGHDCGIIGTHGFSDVPARWDQETACLAELGITTGVTATSFAPNRALTRQEAAAFLARAYTALTGKDCNGTHPFTDIGQAGWNGTAVGCLWELGLTTGTSDTTFSPMQPVTREEFAAFLSRLYSHLTGKTCSGEHPFTDIGQDGWNGTAVGCLWELGLTTGTGPTTYAPTDQVTRLEAAIFISRLTTHLT